MKRIVLLILALAALTPGYPASSAAQTLFEAAMAKMAQAGALAQQGKFAPANELITAASAEIDRAVAMAPDDIELRARRGLLFARFPYLPGRAATSAQDLRFVKDHPRFKDLPAPLRARVEQALAGTHPDRFPQVPAEASPVVAVVSFTVPAQRGTTPSWIESTTKAMKGYPGLLGTHAVASVDHPGMYLLFTWWTDKAALNSFFYGDLHQGWMRRRGVTMTTPQAPPAPEAMPTQTAAEILTGFPAPGLRINGGFVPDEVLKRLGSAQHPSAPAR